MSAGRVVADGTGPVGRLADTLEVTDVQGAPVVRMSRPPGHAVVLTPERADAYRAGLAELVPGTALDEPVAQNQQLIAALDQVRAQRDESARLNVEVEETNHGVLALDHQLSDELEPVWSDVDVRAVFDQLRGTLQAVSAPGEGSVFTVSLPCTAA